MSNIKTSFNDLPDHIKAEAEEILLRDYDVVVKIGDLLMSEDYGYIGTVTNIEPFTDFRWGGKDNKDKIEFKNYRIYYTDNRYKQNGGESNFEANKCFGGSGWGRYYVYPGTLSQLKKEALDIINGETSIDSQDEKKDPGVMAYDKNTFVALKRDIVIKGQILNSKIAMSKSIVKNKLYAIQKHAEGLLKEVKRLTGIIWTIELYLGINESIEHLQTGTPAGEEQPIRLLQERLYMDEEVGDPTNGGLDIRSIEQFIDWLFVKSDYFGYQNYKLLLPYEKCIRIMRVRREQKNYGDPWTNMAYFHANFETFILIRNGENVYAIQTDMTFGSKLFPDQDEIMSLIERTKSDTDFRYRVDEEKVNDTIEMYKRNMIIIQGLIDRTEVFGHLFGKVNIMNGTAIEKGHIEFIYDADQSQFIGTGVTSFLERLKTPIEAGDRALVLKTYYDNDKRGGFYKIYRNYYPHSPSSGIYNILYDNEYHKLYFKFLPGDEIYTREEGYKQRTRKESYALDAFSSENVINFDQFSHRDIQYLWDMQHDRRLRKHYARYMAILKLLIYYKKKELAQEEPFVKLVQSQTGCDEMEALDALHWWKTKNKHKRALTVDDAKALRMIIKKIKNNA